MKKRKLVATLLALIMVMALATTSASALSLPPANVPTIVPDPYTSEVLIPSLVLDVAVDGTIIRDVTVYQGTDGNFRVYSYQELVKIFPELVWLYYTDLYYSTEFYPPRDGIVIDDYIRHFGYTAEVCNTTLNIYTSASTQTYEVYYNNFYAGTSDTPFFTTIPNNCNVVYSGNRIYINDDGNSPVEVMVNGNLIYFPDQQPVIVSPGRTMVPVRAVAELLGCSVEWIDNCAVISRGWTTMYISPGKDTYVLNGQHYTLDAPAQVVKGRTMVPLRFIAEAFGFNVGFEPGTVATVTLN